MEYDNVIKPDSGVMEQTSGQNINDYDLSCLMNIWKNGFPPGGIIDIPPNVFSFQNQFAEIEKNLRDPTRDNGATQALAKEAAIVLISKKYPAAAAFARPMVDAAAKQIEMAPSPVNQVQNSNCPPAGLRKTEPKENTASKENTKPVKKRGRGI